LHLYGGRAIMGVRIRKEHMTFEEELEANSKPRTKDNPLGYIRKIETKTGTTYIREEIKRPTTLADELFKL